MADEQTNGAGASADTAGTGVGGDPADIAKDLTKVNVSDLAGELGAIDDAAAVRAAKKADTRPTAQPIYDARLQQLGGAPRPPSDRSEPEQGKGNDAKGDPRRTFESTTKVVVKQRGERIQPGKPITIENIEEARRLVRDGAIEPFE